MQIIRPHRIAAHVILTAVISMVLINIAQAHSGHTPLQVHSHTGSPMMWLMLGVAALGFSATALFVRKLWCQKRDVRSAQKNR